MLNSSEYLFVYGTLRHDAATPMSRIITEHAIFIDYAYLQGKLYNTGSYPAAIVSNDPQDRVLGEVYYLRAASWPILDAYEACDENYPEPREYERRQVNVQTQGGSQLCVWTYCYCWPVDSLELIPCGDYVRFLRQLR